MHRTPIDFPLPDEATRLFALLASPHAQRILEAVSSKERPDGVAISDLEKVTGLSQPAVSRLVSRLNRAGLIHGSISVVTKTPGRPATLWRPKEGPPWDVLRVASRAS